MVGVEGRSHITQEPYEATTNASELRRDGGNAQVEGCDSDISDGGKARGRCIFYRRGEGQKNLTPIVYFVLDLWIILYYICILTYVLMDFSAPIKHQFP